MKPQSCKSKGRRFQQRIAQSILEAFPHLSPDDVVSTSMGANGEDIRLSELARASVPLSLECKCVEKLNVWSCLEQAESNARPGAPACLVFSKNRSPTYAVLPWPVLLKLLQGGGQRPALPPRLRLVLRHLHACLQEEGGALLQEELGEVAEEPSTEPSAFLPSEEE